MDVRDFLGLRPTHNPHRWTLPVVPGISTSANFLFGGCGLAACVAALESATGRPLVWATAQYLAYASPPSILDIDVIVAVAGRHVTQARAVGHVCDREILTVNAALGHRDFPVEEQWPHMPDVPPPAECPRLPWPGGDESIASRFDLRVARGNPRAVRDGTPSADGHSALWVHVAEGLDVSAGALAIVADWMPSGIGQALGRWAGGNSLDNTLRILRPTATSWVLCDIQIDGVHDGFAHGQIRLWSEGGVLMAVGGQSAIVRFFGDAPMPVAAR